MDAHVPTNGWSYSEPAPPNWAKGECDDLALLERRAWHFAKQCAKIENIVERAKEFATLCHSGIYRKYEKPPVPYIVHPARGAKRVMLLPGSTPEMTAAFWLHDTREDCGVTDEILRFLFPDTPLVADFVDDLTNRFKKAVDANGKLLNRKARKDLEFERIRTIRPESKRMKLVDRIDNLRDMQQNGDWGFVVKYTGEAEQLSAVAGEADEDLNNELKAIIASIRAMKR